MCFAQDSDYGPVTALVLDIISLVSHSLAWLTRPAGVSLICASKSARHAGDGGSVSL